VELKTRLGIALEALCCASPRLLWNGLRVGLWRFAIFPYCPLLLLMCLPVGLARAWALPWGGGGLPPPKKVVSGSELLLPSSPFGPGGQVAASGGDAIAFDRFWCNFGEA